MPVITEYNKDTITIPHGEPDDLAMICFTSGSSGVSKGVMIVNRGINNNVKETLKFFPEDKNRDYLSILPLAHMSGFIGDFLPQLIYNKHLHIYKAPLTIESINEAIKLCRPYMFISVPQIYMALYAKYGKLTVIHLDAHRDLAFEFIGEKYSHATVMRRAHETGAGLVQIGIHSSSSDEEEFVKSMYNIQTFKNKDVHKHMDAIEYYLINIDGPIYVSIDMDVVDPAIEIGRAHV